VEVVILIAKVVGSVYLDTIMSSNL